MTDDKKNQMEDLEVRPEELAEATSSEKDPVAWLKSFQSSHGDATEEERLENAAEFIRTAGPDERRMILVVALFDASQKGVKEVDGIIRYLTDIAMMDIVAGKMKATKFDGHLPPQIQLAYSGLQRIHIDIVDGQLRSLAGLDDGESLNKAVEQHPAEVEAAHHIAELTGRPTLVDTTKLH